MSICDFVNLYLYSFFVQMQVFCCQEYQFKKFAHLCKTRNVGNSAKNERILNKAFNLCDNVILIVSVNQAHH